MSGQAEKNIAFRHMTKGTQTMFGAIVAVLLSHPTALPAAPPSGFEQCALISDRSLRLDCYDALAHRKETKQTVSPNEKSTSTVSKVESTEKEETESRKLSFLVPADRWQFEADQRVFRLTPYKLNYILPLAYNDSPNDAVWRQGESNASIDHNEIKYQLSSKVKVWDNLLDNDVDLWFAYSQLSFWQAYNSSLSAPFRETNYEPEAFLSFRTDWGPIFGFTNRVVNIGFTHQSNGRSQTLSRSWNRIYASFGLERDDFGLMLRPWYRIPEDDADDDNPDIHQYLGYGELYGYAKWGESVFVLTLRNNLRSSENRGAVQIDWGFPLHHGLKGYVQYFNGYGESLLDYNTTSNRIGLGLMLFNWL